MEEVNFPKVGDLCPTCADWHATPKTLKPLGTLMRGGQVVAACEYCDGERIFAVYEETQKRLNNPDNNVE